MCGHIEQNMCRPGTHKTDLAALKPQRAASESADFNELQFWIQFCTDPWREVQEANLPGKSWKYELGLEWAQAPWSISSHLIYLLFAVINRTWTPHSVVVLDGSQGIFATKILSREKGFILAGLMCSPCLLCCFLLMSCLVLCQVL